MAGEADATNTMEIVHRVVGPCVVVDLTADVLEYPKTTVLKNHVTRLIQEGNRSFVLNLSGVKLLDSFAIASFISILKLCKANEGSLGLCGLNEATMRLLEITHMDRVLSTWTTEQEAVTELSK